jgi:hypothetical protein
VLSIYQKSLSFGVSNWRLSKPQKNCTHHHAVAQPSTKKKQSMAPTCQMKIKRQGTAAATSHNDHTNHILEHIIKKEQKRSR